MKKDKEVTQIIILLIVTLILLIIALFITEKRNKKEETTNDITTEVVTTTVPFKNEYCDTNHTPIAAHLKYSAYIYISAIDEKGCGLIDNKDNKSYIAEKQLEAATMADEKVSSLVLPSGAAIKTGQTTIRNENGNILGWVIQAFYSDGINSNKYILNTNDEWIEID